MIEIEDLIEAFNLYLIDVRKEIGLSTEGYLAVKKDITYNSFTASLKDYDYKVYFIIPHKHKVLLFSFNRTLNSNISFNRCFKQFNIEFCKELYKIIYDKEVINKLINDDYVG